LGYDFLIVLNDITKFERIVIMYIRSKVLAEVLILKKILLVLCVLSAVAWSWNCAWGAGDLFHHKHDQNSQGYAEFDIEDGLHVSFKGAFRANKKYGENFVIFGFVVLPQKDIWLRVNQSELFDSKGTRFNNDNHRTNLGWRPDIGIEKTEEREIIEGIPMIVQFYFDMPSSKSEELPLIARARFCFNGKWIELRKVQVEEWSVWQEIKAELGS